MSPYNIQEKSANNLVDEFLLHFKNDFGDKIDPLILSDMGTFKFDGWGIYMAFSIYLSFKSTSYINNHLRNKSFSYNFCIRVDIILIYNKIFVFLFS
jgi:hypothetical protein